MIRRVLIAIIYTCGGCGADLPDGQSSGRCSRCMADDPGARR